MEVLSGLYDAKHMLIQKGPKSRTGIIWHWQLGSQNNSSLDTVLRSPESGPSVPGVPTLGRGT